MSIISISLPKKTAQQIDQEAHRKGFSARSEFIRNLIHHYLSEEVEFETFKCQPLEKVKSELANSGKYSQEFIVSVTKGLSQSSLYAHKTLKKRPPN